MPVVSICRSRFAEKTLYLDGKPFSLAGVPFMIPILDCQSERMVEMTGRQVGKSTNNSALMLTAATANNFHRILYVAPRGDQVTQFSKDKLTSMIAYSPFIQDFYINSKVQQQVRAKEFTNGSLIFLRSCYHSGDGARGITANDIYFDEVQDLLLDNLPVIEECSARMSQRQIVYSGTPKTFDNPISQIWEQSTQNYWAVKCTHCNHWNVPLGLDNLSEECLVCAKCKKPINALTGLYAAKYPTRSIAGFHISQLMIYGNPGTGLPWARVMEKYNNPLYGIAKFTNECLGFPYDVGAKLLTEGQVRACSTTDMSDPFYQDEWTVDRKAEWGIQRVGAGVDWGVLGGNTRTVLTIGGLRPDGVLKVFFAKKFPLDQDPVDQVEEIAEYINKAGCAFVAADRGGGHVANSFLRKALPFSRISEIEYKPKVNQGMYYLDKSKSWITDRTRALAGIVIDIKSRQIEFPDLPAMKLYAPDLLVLSCAYNDKLRAYQILRENGITDDFAHALTYLRLACRKMGVTPGARHFALEDFAPPGSEVWVERQLSDDPEMH